MHAASRPRMKITAPLLRGGGRLHVVGIDDVVTLDDPDGAIHRLVGLADGSRSMTELHATLAPEYPRLRPDDVIDAFSQLEAAGFAETSAPQRRAVARAARREPAALFV